MCITYTMPDEGFHEIQLNGKQLVFLFMAATVVAVAVFLCGVMVGRGVPIRAASTIDAPGQATLDPTAAVQEPLAAQAVASSGSGPVTALETLTYPTLLEDPDPPAETLAPPVEPAAAVSPLVAARPTATTPPAAASLKPSAAAVAAKKPAAVAPRAVAAPARPAPVPAPAAVTAAADVSLSEPGGNGFVVQVAAVRQRAEANTIARRLSTKGYPAFVTPAGANFRVRVGKYTDRREAESVAGRLEKEERFKPWITR